MVLIKLITHSFFIERLFFALMACFSAGLAGSPARVSKERVIF